ncbi:MAG: MFS transporter [Hyphomicrobiales bacterium]
MTDVAATRFDLIPAVACMLVMVVVSADLFGMPIATAALSKEFETNAAMVQTAVAGFSLIFAGLCILGGKLGDIYGKKAVFRLGLLLYAVSSAITMLAPSMPVLILSFAVIRAVAVALAVPASVALIVANYRDEQQRGNAFSIYGIGAMVAGIVAPTLMGFMAETVTWRVHFALDVLITLAGWWLAGRLAETEKVKTTIDYYGIVLAFLAIAAIVLGGMLGGTYGWWDMRRPFQLGDMQINLLGLSPAAVCFMAGVVLTLVLIDHSYRSEEKGGTPLFSMRLFDNRLFGVAFVLAIVFFVLNGALPFVVPVFLQEAVGFDASISGVVMMIFMAGSMIGSLGSGQLMQHLQSRTVMQLALAVIVAGLLWLFVESTPNMTLLDAAPPMFVVGLGFGVVVAQIPNITLSTLPDELQGEGAGLSETAKEAGVGLGTAVVASVMFGLAIGGTVDKVAQQVEVEITAEERAELILQIEDERVPADVEQLVGEKAPNFEGLTVDAYVEAFQMTLGLLIGIVMLCLLISSFIPRVTVEQERKGIPT